MVIDFHTHAFPDAIADYAITKLENTIMTSGYPEAEKAVTRGTIGELRNVMKKYSIDKCVLLPIATKPSQQTSVNNWAAEQMDDTIISFGSVHPDAEDWEQELERIKSLGLKGVKLHPDYQDFLANEDKVIPIYRKCAELGLPVILHAGLDAYSLNLIHCTPQMSADILEKVPGLTLILAHMGGNRCWDDVEKYLVGKNVYFDTAFISRGLTHEQAKRIIHNHGVDKILFASDCPWHLPSIELEFIDKLELSCEQIDIICYKNAERLIYNT